MDSEKRPKPDSGIELFLDCRVGKFEVLRASRVAEVPRLSLRERSVESLSMGTDDRYWNDIVVSFFDKAGDALESFGMPAKGTRYADWLSANGHICGGPQHIRSDEMDLRCLRLPLPGGTEWMSVSQAPAVRMMAEPLRFFYVGNEDPPPESPVRSFGAQRMRVEQLPWAEEDAVRRKGRSPTPLFPGLHEDFRTDDGEITSIRTYDPDKDPREHFDIVITGDGFHSRDDDRFSSLATRVINGLSNMEPFNDRLVRPLINWHVVHVASKDSGIDHCTTAKPLKTFYKTQGYWHGTVRSFLGTGEVGLRRIWWAARKAVPVGGPDLIIVIANCPWYGGHGYPGGKLVIVPSCESRPRLFVGMVAHECGHAIPPPLADEYISGEAEDPSRPDHNKAHLADVIGSVHRQLLERTAVKDGGGGTSRRSRDPVWWTGLAKKRELHQDGTFRAVHLPGDPRSSRTDPRPLIADRSYQQYLGAFWGCQDRSGKDDLVHTYCDIISGESPNSSTLDRLKRILSRNVDDDEATWWDPTAAGYFRPMGVCRMRQVTYEFCRVCQHLLKNAIKGVCGKPMEPPLPPGVRP